MFFRNEGRPGVGGSCRQACCQHVRGQWGDEVSWPVCTVQAPRLDAVTVLSSVCLGMRLGPDPLLSRV